ncbi:MAG TPA: hypothetical protein VH370_24780 [Humisphaera sp.]|jgi:hypothetical protein|nr:hypothetical protein [Humisphaera sp.]
MSRLDQHIRVVQGKMALDTFLRALAWSLIVLCCAIGLSHIVQRAIAHYLPHTAGWYWGATAMAVAFPMVYAILRRPTAHEAAVAIDDRLSLKEKFSTALYIRANKDPFSGAALRDAERTADKVSLAKRFPIEIPRASLGSLGAALALLPIFAWMPELDLFGAEKTRQVQAKKQEATVAAAQRDVKRAIAAIEAASKEVNSDEQIKLAAKELPEMFKKAGNDPTRVAKRAQETLKEIESIKQKIDENHKFATAKNEINNFKNMSAPTPDETGPVADAHRQIAEGKLQDAVDSLKKAVDNFDKMDKQQQEKAADQMQKLAQQIQQQANDPKVQQQMQQQLQQAGVSQQQAQQMQQLMQQAANGNQQAQQQLQNMANQAAQQANQQQGGSTQQQLQRAQQIQQAVAQAQQAANAQANAQAMQQAAQQLAQAMKQGAGQSQTQGGSKQGGQGQQQQMAQAAGAMQQQLQQLQAQANGAAGIAAGQQGGAAGQGGQQGGQAGQQGMANAGQGQQGQNGQGPGQNGQGQGQGQGQNGAGQGPGQGQQGQGEWAQGDPRNQGAGSGGPGVSAGGKRPNPTEAPFGTKTELSQSQTNDKGRILASSFVKAPAERGTSNMSLSQVAESEIKDATDEVQQDRIPRSSWNAVKGYFDTLKKTDQPSK